MPADETGCYRVLQATKKTIGLTFVSSDIVGAIDSAATTTLGASGVHGPGPTEAQGGHSGLPAPNVSNPQPN